MQEINLIVDGIVAVVKIEPSENHLEAIVSSILFNDALGKSFMGPD